MNETHRHAPASQPPLQGVRVTVARGETAGASITLDGTQPGRVLVGTSPACDLQLTDRAVSRRHLALELSGNALRVRDLDSTNGTFVAGVRLFDGLVEPPASLEIGGSVLQVERTTHAAPPTEAREAFGRMIGASQVMRRLYPLCDRLAASDIPVIIEGETGTGKEALAEALHEMGPRNSGPFVVFDCTIVPDNLMEAELFGHARGAFTGATEARDGVFLQAHGGTLLLDEIGDLSPQLQPKLLRAIDRGEIRPIGKSASVRADVRIIAATRRDLDREVHEGRFRDDLFHRLAVGRVELPPLRERRGDIARLARAFWTQLGGDEAHLTRALLRRWESHRWPGNVRELRNTVARQLALGELAGWKPDTAPEPSAWLDAILALPLKEAKQRMMLEFERRYVQAMLQRHDGNVTRAAEAAGVARRYFQVVKARSK